MSFFFVPFSIVAIMWHEVGSRQDWWVFQPSTCRNITVHWLRAKVVVSDRPTSRSFGAQFEEHEAHRFVTPPHSSSPRVDVPGDYP
ncbi:hypothetical protein BX600DRAFT_12445 [Xylariales sp. PMI_506]|nr:hypothetical protein BX600DRAFT_12445 [Xylariales sp. PMI_506]